MIELANPFKPGAGHQPPHLAGRQAEKREFLRLLKQNTILENMVLTGLRGVGKTVLLETLKPLASEKNWMWVGADLSESASLTEESIATRLCTDLSPITATVIVSRKRVFPIGFAGSEETLETTLNYAGLRRIYSHTPGLALDKLKTVLESAWNALSSERGVRGIIFAYDEAQNLADHSEKEEFPLSLLLDTFQSLQRKGLPLMLVLTGLPTLFPQLVDARTFCERMFRVVFLESLSDAHSREAILRPFESMPNVPLLDESSVDTIISMSGGYPYFIQFICREVYDVFVQCWRREETASVPIREIQQKLDTDFFSARWARTTDRQRDLLFVISQLPDCDREFTVQEIVEKSKEVPGNSFSGSHANQMLSALARQGLIFKNRHGKYSFAVPLLGAYIRRNFKAGGA